MCVKQNPLHGRLALAVYSILVKRFEQNEKIIYCSIFISKGWSAQIILQRGRDDREIYRNHLVDVCVCVLVYDVVTIERWATRNASTQLPAATAR